MAETMTSSFLLPDGNVQLALSGGRTSAYMLHKVLEANGALPDRVKVLFTNTGRERKVTLEFVHEIETRWGVDVVWLEYGYDNGPRAIRVNAETATVNAEPFERLLEKRRFLPNQNKRFCTEELKIKTARRWLVAQGWRHWTKAVGMRADEPARLKPKPQPREAIWHPLAEAGVTKAVVAAFWSKQPFDLRLPIVNGKTIGGNCRKCFLKSEAAIAAEIRDDPADDWPDRMEAKYGGTFSKRYSQKDLRAFIAGQGDWIFDVNDQGIFCQKDGGECTG